VWLQFIRKTLFWKSVLSAISKIFETAIEKQLSDHFENLFNPLLAAFRSGYGCQSTLLRILEDWKNVAWVCLHFIKGKP
jgi:uncharacterized protein YggT (Ycf19 family)